MKLANKIIMRCTFAYLLSIVLLMSVNTSLFMKYANNFFLGAICTVTLSYMFNAAIAAPDTVSDSKEK